MISGEVPAGISLFRFFPIVFHIDKVRKLVKAEMKNFE
jgi:hypothetical protein